MSVQSDEIIVQQEAAEEGRGEMESLNIDARLGDEFRLEEPAAEEGRGGPGTNVPLVDNKTKKGQRQSAYYTKSKTVAEGVMDIGLMIATVSQFKAVLDAGDSHDYYIPVLVLTVLCFILQVIVGVLIVDLWANEQDNADDKRSFTINRTVVMLIFIITVFNIIIGVLGLTAPQSLI